MMFNNLMFEIQVIIKMLCLDESNVPPVQLNPVVVIAPEPSVIARPATEAE